MQPRQRRENENPKDYILDTYTSIELVQELNEATAIYRLDPFIKYVCSWKTDVNQDEYKAITQRINWKHPNLVGFIFADPFSPTIRVFYEYLPTDLRQLITKRSKCQSFIPESEIVDCLKGLSSAMAFLYNKGLYHGAIQLESVYFDEEYLIYRVQDVSLFRVKAPSLFNHNYPAPELSHSYSVDRYKVDVFNLGIVLVCMMGLKDQSNFFQQGQLQTPLLIKNLEEISRIYSYGLCQIVNSMLEIDVLLRPNWNTLLQKIEEFQSGLTKPKVYDQSIRSKRESIFKESMFIQESLSDRRQSVGRPSLRFQSQYSDRPKLDEKLQQLSKKISETLAKSSQQLRS